MSDIHLQDKGGYWYFNCGAALDSKQVRKAKKHCLGKDYQLAQIKARALDLAWQMETATDPVTKLKVWSPGRIESAIAFAVGTPTAAPKAATAKATPVVPAEKYVAVDSYTLDAALDEFVKRFQTRTDCSEAWRQAISDRMKSAKRHISEFATLPLAEIGHEHFERIRNIILARPKSGVNDGPISIETAKNWLQVLSMAFDHFSKLTQKYHWTAPNPWWHEAFILTKKQQWSISTLEERGSAGTPKPIYTIQEVSAMYKRTTPRVKKYILMGVLFGWKQQEITDFRKDELQPQNGEHFIERARGKTGVRGRWWVPPQVATMLLETIQATPANPDNRAFLTQDGQPLCHGGTDSIALAWRKMLKKHLKSDQQKLGFGSLRRLAGQLIQDVSGSHELAQMVLSQSKGTVAAKHYVSGFATSGIGVNQSDRLVEEQKKVWAGIKGFFFPAAPATLTVTEATSRQAA